MSDKKCAYCPQPARVKLDGKDVCGPCYLARAPMPVRQRPVTQVPIPTPAPVELRAKVPHTMHLGRRKK